MVAIDYCSARDQPRDPAPLVRTIWWLGPSGWRFHAAVSALALALLLARWLSQSVSLHFLYVLGVAIQLGWLAVGGAWTIATLVSLIAPEPRTPGERRRLKWWLAPILALLLSGSEGAHIVQFWVARPSLEARMRATTGRTPLRIDEDFQGQGRAAYFGNGVYRLSNGTYVLGYDLLFSHPLDFNGFACCASPPPADEWSPFVPIVGKWYFFHGG